MSHINAVRSNVHSGSGQMAVFPLDAGAVHQLVIADADLFPVNHSGYTVAGTFLNRGHAAFIQMPAVCFDNRQGNGVIGIAFRERGNIQKLGFRHFLCVHGGHFKSALRQRAGFVEYHGVHFGKRFQIVGTFN